MNFPEALIYLRRRFGDNRARGRLLTADATGAVTGCAFRVGRSELTIVGRDVDENRLALFVDDIKYAAAKRAAKKTVPTIGRGEFFNTFEDGSEDRF